MLPRCRTPATTRNRSSFSVSSRPIFFMATHILEKSPWSSSKGSFRGPDFMCCVKEKLPETVGPSDRSVSSEREKTQRRGQRSTRMRCQDKNRCLCFLHPEAPDGGKSQILMFVSILSSEFVAVVTGHKAESAETTASKYCFSRHLHGDEAVASTVRQTNFCQLISQDRSPLITAGGVPRPCGDGARYASSSGGSCFFILYLKLSNL